MNQHLSRAGSPANRPGSAYSDPGCRPSAYPSAPVAVTHLGVALAISLALWAALIGIVVYFAEVAS